MTDLTNLTRRRLLGAGAATGVALVLGACSLEKGASVDTANADPNAGWGGESLAPPMEKPDVTFVDGDGNPYPLREKTAGRLTMMFFGFTSCPDVCPIYLAAVDSALTTIGSGPGSKPIVLFVGVDTERDTPPVMKEYARKFNPSFVGLTADPKVIEQALGDLGLGQPVFGEPDAEGNYEVGHPSTVFVFSPQDDGAHRYYPSDTRQQQWVKDLPRLDRGLFS